MVCTPLTAKEVLAVERVDRQAVRVLAADELAGILGQAVDARVIAARRDGERHATERPHFEADAAWRRQREQLSTEAKRQFRRQAE